MAIVTVITVQDYKKNFRVKKQLPPFEQKYIKETDLKWSLKFKVKGNDTMPVKLSHLSL